MSQQIESALEDFNVLAKTTREEGHYLSKRCSKYHLKNKSLRKSQNKKLFSSGC